MQDSWLGKKADEIQSCPLQTERIWNSFLMHSRQYMFPRAQEPPHSLVQMELVFWLTEKLTWKDGLNTLMVSLIGHHLSMTTTGGMYSAAWWAPDRLWNSENNKTPVTWQGSWIRCNTCRDLQSRRSFSCRRTNRVFSHYVEKRKAISQEFKDATIIHLFKRKVNPQVCDNHRGISSLSIAGKILARVLLNRLNEHLEQSGLLPESQCGFRKDRGTIDMIFTARQLQEKCQEQNVDLYMTFVDLTKALENYGKI